MNLARMLGARAEAGKPIRVAIIAAGKFSTMFLAQARHTPGLHIVAIADLDVAKARQSCLRCGWPEEQVSATSAANALADGTTWLTDDAETMIRTCEADVVVEATGHPPTAIRHCLLAIEYGRHIVMVTVEGDALAGPLLAQKAEQAGLVYSLAWGDQPAQMCDLVDWARTSGFKVVCAGRGAKYHPSYHQSTPDTVWDVFFMSAEQAKRGGMNAKMYNSFIDGTKPSVETAATCNATGLRPQAAGLSFPGGTVSSLSEICKPKSAGGTLDFSGTVEVINCINPDYSPIENNILQGTFVTVEAEHEYVSNCFEDFMLLPDKSFKYASLYRPIHLIGLELGVSVASVALRGEPTGSPICFNADVVATAKRDLKAGEILDGEGGYCVWGKLTPAPQSLAVGGLPLGLAQDVKLLRDVPQGAQLTWTDVAIDETDHAVKFRREMEATFAPQDMSRAAE